MKQKSLQKSLFVLIFLSFFQNIFASQQDQVVKVLRLAKAIKNPSNQTPASKGLESVGGLKSFSLSFTSDNNQNKTSVLSIDLSQGASSKFYAFLTSTLMTTNVVLEIKMEGIEFDINKNQYYLSIRARDADTLQYIPGLCYENSYKLPVANGISSGTMTINTTTSAQLSVEDLELFYVGIYQGAIFVVPNTLETFKAIYKPNPSRNITHDPSQYEYFNFNFNNINGSAPNGYCFLSDPWNNDIDTNFDLKTGTGISQTILGWKALQPNLPLPLIVSLLAFDADGNYITDFSTPKTAYTMALCIYNGNNNDNIGFTPAIFSAQNYNGNTAGTFPTITTNAFAFGATTVIPTFYTPAYPFLLSFNY